MYTLIELYDERAIENVLGPDVFRPQHVVYLCPQEIADDHRRQRQYLSFFKKRGYTPDVEFIACSLYDTKRIEEQLLSIHSRCPDCALDITGGTDAALFASGVFAAQKDVAVFTYSRKSNMFFSISNAPFADHLPCTLAYDTEDFILIAGGSVRTGRTGNQELERYMAQIDDFFALYMKYRRIWTDQIAYMQRVSPDSDDLRVESPKSVPGDRNRKLKVNTDMLADLQGLRLICDLAVTEESVSFNFADSQVRTWLRDVGSVLELYTYKACRDAGIFQDVRSSVIVDWNDAQGQALVSNEIDAMAARGVIPLFISCKTCAIKTEALNELAILSDRFGGKGAKALIITAEKCNAAARHRAAQLGIAVIDPEELAHEALIRRLQVIMKADAPDKTPLQAPDADKACNLFINLVQ